MSGVRIAPPTMAITINDPPSLVFGPSPFRPRAKIVGNMSDMKKLVANNAHRPAQLGRNMAKPTNDNIHHCVRAKQFSGGYEAHKPCRDKPSNAERSKGASEKISRNFFGLVGELLHVLNEIAPRPNLCTDIHELRENCHEEVWVGKEFAKVTLIAARSHVRFGCSGTWPGKSARPRIGRVRSVPDKA